MTATLNEDLTALLGDAVTPPVDTPLRPRGRVATHCFVCGRELVDATSVEFGIGPICRKRHDYGDAYPVTFEMVQAICLALAPGGVDVEGIEATWLKALATALENDTTRKAANLVVYRLSCNAPLQATPEVMALLDVLRIMGYLRLTDVALDRLSAIRISIDAGEYVVKTPYDEAFIADLRRIPGRWYEGAIKANHIPGSKRAELWTALRRHFTGSLGVGPKGTFII